MEIMLITYKQKSSDNDNLERFQLHYRYFVFNKSYLLFNAASTNPKNNG